MWLTNGKWLLKIDGENTYALLFSSKWHVENARASKLLNNKVSNRLDIIKTEGI